MTNVLLIIHLFVTLALIGVVLIQRSEGGGLGIGSSQGMGAFMSGRGTANLLTRTTAVLAAVFFALSLTLALMNRGTSGMGSTILDSNLPTTPASSTAPKAPAPPPAPSLPTPGMAPATPTPPGAASAPAPTPAPAPAPSPATPTH